MRTYFITGATGVVGNEIAAQLLAESDARLLLLIRADDEEQAVARLDELIAYWKLDPDSVRRRIDVVRGDTERPRFGLAEARYRSIASSVTHMVHSAALVRMNLPLQQASSAAVRSAENVIELARACRASGQLRKVEFLSTVGVAGRMPGTLPERWVSEHRTFHNTYEQAKADAELLVARACEEGLPITLFRPSMVVGAAATGRVIRFQVFYHLVEFLSGRRTHGIYPALGAARIDLVPVDFVARSVAWSSGTADTVGRVLHLCSGPADALPLRDLRELVRATLRARGVSVPRAVTVPRTLLRATLPLVRALAPPDAKRALGTLPIFLDYLGGEQSFGNDETRAVLARAGLSFPAPREFIGPVLDYYLSRRERRASRSAARDE
jgi:thioester reductase-like protein